VVTSPILQQAVFESIDSKALEWFALQVRGTRTVEVAKALRYKGCEAFTPSKLVKRRWCDRTRMIEYPLFPGYVFAKVDLRHRFPILITPGVLGIVGVGKQPVPISDKEIASFQGVLRSGLTVRSWPFLRRGDRVRIEEGPLSGVTGILIEDRKTYRVVVSVELIQRSIAVEVDRDAVSALKSAQPTKKSGQPAKTDDRRCVLREFAG
jgi:transcription antitermination factor NusG